MMLHLVYCRTYSYLQSDTCLSNLNATNKKKTVEQQSQKLQKFFLCYRCRYISAVEHTLSCLSKTGHRWRFQTSWAVESPLKSNQAKLSVSVCVPVFYIYPTSLTHTPIAPQIKTFIFRLLVTKPAKSISSRRFDAKTNIDPYNFQQTFPFGKLKKEENSPNLHCSCFSNLRTTRLCRKIHHSMW